MAPLLQISQGEQELVQVPRIQGTSASPVSVLTSLISSIPNLQQFDTMLDPSFFSVAFFLK